MWVCQIIQENVKQCTNVGLDFNTMSKDCRKCQNMPEYEEDGKSMSKHIKII